MKVNYYKFDDLIMLFVDFPGIFFIIFYIIYCSLNEYLYSCRIIYGYKGFVYSRVLPLISHWRRHLRGGKARRNESLRTHLHTDEGGSRFQWKPK